MNLPSFEFIHTHQEVWTPVMLMKQSGTLCLLWELRTNSMKSGLNSECFFKCRKSSFLPIKWDSAHLARTGTAVLGGVFSHQWTFLNPFVCLVNILPHTRALLQSRKPRGNRGQKLWRTQLLNGWVVEPARFLTSILVKRTSPGAQAKACDKVPSLWLTMCFAVNFYIR